MKKRENEHDECLELRDLEAGKSGIVDEEDSMTTELTTLRPDGIFDTGGPQFPGVNGDDLHYYPRGFEMVDPVHVDEHDETLLNGIKEVLNGVERGARFSLGVVASGLRIAEFIPAVDDRVPVNQDRSGSITPTGRLDPSPDKLGKTKMNQPQRSNPNLVNAVEHESPNFNMMEGFSAGYDFPGQPSFESPPNLNHYPLPRSSSDRLQQETRPAIEYSINELSFMTYNAGLLQYSLLGMTLFQNPPFTDVRVQHLPVALKSASSDFIALQEVFSDVHADKIVSELLTAYPFHARQYSGDWFRLHNGLMLLSKFPITRSRFHSFKDVTRMERVFASKGFQEVTVSVPDVGNLCLINIHLASGAIDPESRSIELLRNAEIEQIMLVANDASQRGDAPVIMGDINAAPDLCPSNYNQFIRLGMIDSFLQASVGIPSPNPLLWQEESLRGLSIADETFWKSLPPPDDVTAGIRYAERYFHTWDPLNPLNRLGPHAGCMGSRCDHIFTPHPNKIPESPLRDFYPARSCIKLQAPRVLVESFFTGIFGSRLVTLSDHYGVQIHMRRRPHKATT